MINPPFFYIMQLFLPKTEYNKKIYLQDTRYKYFNRTQFDTFFEYKGDFGFDWINQRFLTFSIAEDLTKYKYVKIQDGNNIFYCYINKIEFQNGQRSQQKIYLEVDNFYDKDFNLDLVNGIIQRTTLPDLTFKKIQVLNSTSYIYNRNNIYLNEPFNVVHNNISLLQVLDNYVNSSYFSINNGSIDYKNVKPGAKANFIRKPYLIQNKAQEILKRSFGSNNIVTLSEFIAKHNFIFSTFADKVDITYIFDWFKTKIDLNSSYYFAIYKKGSGWDWNWAGWIMFITDKGFKFYDVRSGYAEENNKNFSYIIQDIGNDLSNFIEFINIIITKYELGDPITNLNPQTPRDIFEKFITKFDFNEQTLKLQTKPGTNKIDNIFGDIEKLDYQLYNNFNLNPKLLISPQFSIYRIHSNNVVMDFDLLTSTNNKILNGKICDFNYLEYEYVDGGYAILNILGKNFNDVAKYLKNEIVIYNNLLDYQATNINSINFTRQQLDINKQRAEQDVIINMFSSFLGTAINTGRDVGLSSLGGSNLARFSLLSNLASTPINLANTIIQNNRTLQDAERAIEKFNSSLKDKALTNSVAQNITGLDDYFKNYKNKNISLYLITPDYSKLLFYNWYLNKFGWNVNNNIKLDILKDEAKKNEKYDYLQFQIINNISELSKEINDYLLNLFQAGIWLVYDENFTVEEFNNN